MKNYPAIKVTLLFIIGILSEHFFDVNILVVIVLFIAGLVLLIFNKSFSDNFYYSLLLILVSGILVFSIGNLLAKENKISFAPFLTKIDKVKNATAVGEINKIDLIKNNELILYLNVDSVYSEDFYIKDKVQLLCKIKSDNKFLFTLYNELKPGNYLKLSGYYYKGREERNPGEFDYDAYLKSNGIMGILSINDTSSIKIINHNTAFLKNLIHQVRKKIDWQIKKYQSPETASLLRGLLLADRKEINYQTKQQFINAGVVHVLAVSGLHVGYIILIFLLT